MWRPANERRTICTPRAYKWMTQSFHTSVIPYTGTVVSELQFCDNCGRYRVKNLEREPMTAFVEAQHNA